MRLLLLLLFDILYKMINYLTATPALQELKRGVQSKISNGLLQEMISFVRRVMSPEGVGPV